MNANDLACAGGGMEYARTLAVFEENLASLDLLSFLDPHAGLHARKVVGHHGYAGARSCASHDLKRSPRDGEVEALLTLMQCHVCSWPSLGRSHVVQETCFNFDWC